MLKGFQVNQLVWKNRIDIYRKKSEMKNFHKKLYSCMIKTSKYVILSIIFYLFIVYNDYIIVNVFFMTDNFGRIPLENMCYRNGGKLQ